LKEKEERKKAFETRKSDIKAKAEAVTNLKKVLG